MIYLGVDWATDKHDVCVVAEDGRILSEFQIPHDSAGFERLREQVQPLAPVKVNIERADGLLVEWMLQQGYEVHVTPPNVVAHRRPRRSKDDRGDAYLLAYLLRVGDPDTRPVIRPSEAAVALRQLAAAYDTLLREQRQLTNRLIYALRQYYPAMLKLFSVPNSLICLAFLEAYPTPSAARILSRADLAAFLRSHHYSRLDRLPEMYALLQSPAPQATVIVGHLAALRLLIPTLRLLHLERTQLTKQISEAFQTHPDSAWLQSVPGAAGPLTGARLLAWMGDDRQRFPTPGILQATAGTAPITRRSGKQLVVEFRRACSHPLRKAFDDLAHQSVKHSGWAASYFHDQCALGHSKVRAYRALANRWAKIIWTLWQQRALYSEAKHLANRSSRGQPTILTA